MKSLKNSAYATSLTGKKDKKNLLISGSNDIDNFASVLPSLINGFLHDSEAEKRSTYEKAVISRNKKKYSIKLLASASTTQNLAAVQSKSLGSLNNTNENFDQMDDINVNDSILPSSRPVSTLKNKKSKRNLEIEIENNNKDENFVQYNPSLYQSSYIFNENDLKIPEYLVFSDFLSQKSRTEINLSGWIVNKEILRLIRISCKDCSHLTLDRTKSLNDDNFKELNGHLGIKILDLSNLNCVISSNFTLTLISFRNLTRLSFANSTITASVIDLISSHCKVLKEFNLSNVKGLTSLDLHSVAFMIEKYKNLEKLDISHGKDFKDESVLDILKAGQHILTDLNISHCNHLSTLAFVGLRNKIAVKTLNLSNLLVTSTAYEWISEGCRNVEILNISNNSHLDDLTLSKIGKSCKVLKKLNIANCVTLTDTGLIDFFENFKGILTHLNIEGCYNISSDFLYSIVSSNKNINELLSVNFNGLSRINSDSLSKFFNLTKKLKYFSMCSDLSSTSSNRHSSMPHISDATFLNSSIYSLQEVYLVGAGQITDIGFKILAETNSNLKVIDVSGCARISDQSIKVLAENCLLLETIRLNGCGYITDKSLFYLSNSTLVTSLKELQLNSCNKITNFGLEKLIRFPNLEKLTLRSCDLIDNNGILNYVTSLKYGVPPVFMKKEWELVNKAMQQILHPPSNSISNLNLSSPSKMSSSIRSLPNSPSKMNSSNKYNYSNNIYKKFHSKVSSNYTSHVNNQIQALLKIAEMVSSSGFDSLSIFSTEKKNSNIFKLSNNDPCINNFRQASIVYMMIDWYIEEIEEKLNNKRIKDLNEIEGSPVKKKKVITEYSNANTFLNNNIGSVCFDYQSYLNRYNLLITEINNERQIINEFKRTHNIDPSFDDIIDNYLYNNEDIIIEDNPTSHTNYSKLTLLLKNNVKEMTLSTLKDKLKGLLSKNQFKIKKWKYLYDYSLKVFEITNLDYVSSNVLKIIFNDLKNLTVLNADGCSFNSREFNLVITENPMPFFIQYPSTCRTRSRELSIMNYNYYIKKLKFYIVLVNRIKCFLKKYIQINKNIIYSFIKKLMRIKLKKIFSYWYKRYIIIVNSRKLSNLAIIKKIQSWLRKYYVIRYQKRNLLHLKTINRSAILIQKIYRGFKQLVRFKKNVVRLRKIKDNFFLLFTKYLFFQRFRILRKQFIKLIYLRRGLKYYYDYQEKKLLILLLQKSIRKFIAISKYRVMLFNHNENLRIEREALELKSITLIKKNYKSFKFNRQISPFVLYCAIIYDSNYINMIYYIIKIQSLIRRFTVRKKYFKIMKKTVYYNYYLNKIKNFLLSCYNKRFYKKLFKKHTLIIKKLKKFFIYNLIRLRLTKYKCIIVKYMKNYHMKAKMYRAINTINKFFYYIHNQKIANFEKQLLEMKSAIVITHLFKYIQLKKKRKEMLYRQIMAAYKINTFFNMIMIPRRELKYVLDIRKFETEEIKRLKNEKLHERKLQKFEVFKEYYKNGMARKIQKWYRRIIMRRKQKKKLNKFKSLLNHQTEDDELFDHEIQDIDNISVSTHDNQSEFNEDQSIGTLSKKNSVNNIVLLKNSDNGIIGNLALALRPLKRNLNAIIKPFSNILKDYSEVDPLTDKRLQNSVLRYQVQTLKQYGISEIHITIGESETQTFEKLQFKSKQNHLPYYKKIDQDLSNARGFSIFFWVLYDEDAQCINNLIFQSKPKGISKSMMRSRAMDINTQDIGRKLLWYPDLSFEILLSYDLKAKRPAFVITDLVVVRFREEADDLIKKGYVLCADLSSFGFSSIFVLTLSRAPPNEEGLYPYPRLLASPWCDDTVIRVMKTYNLSESDILTLSQLFFNNFHLVNNSKAIRTVTFFESLGYEEISPIIKWVSKLSKSKRLSELNFGEFLQLISSFIMFNRDDLGRFLFQSLDEKNLGYITKEKFQFVVNLLSSNTPFNVSGWINQYENYINKKLSLMFVEGFLKFVRTNPGVVWQLELLQLKFMDISLGRSYWDGKKEQFRVVRKMNDFIVNH